MALGRRVSYWEWLSKPTGRLWHWVGSVKVTQIVAVVLTIVENTDAQIRAVY
jgi:hypothetical protein